MINCARTTALELVFAIGGKRTFATSKLKPVLPNGYALGYGRIRRAYHEGSAVDAQLPDMKFGFVQRRAGARCKGTRKARGPRGPQRPTTG